MGFEAVPEWQFLLELTSDEVDQLLYGNKSNVDMYTIL